MATDPLDLYAPAPVFGLGDPTAPAPEGPSATGAFGRAAVRSAAPTAAGVAAFPAGAAVGGLLGSVGGPIGAGVGGVAGGLATSFGAGWLVDDAIEMLPERVKRIVGIDRKTLAADAAAHPYASFAGGVAPQIAFMRPGRGMTALTSGAGAAIGGGVEAGQEYAETGTIDPIKVGAQAAIGGLLNKNTRLGELTMRPAVAVAARIPTGAGTTAAAAGAREALREAVASVGGRAAETREVALARLFPALPASVQRRWLAAGTVDDHIAVADAEATIGEHRTPDERAAAAVLEDEAAVHESNPWGQHPDAVQSHGEQLAATIAAVVAGRPLPAVRNPMDIRTGLLTGTVGAVDRGAPAADLSRDAVISFVIDKLEGGGRRVVDSGGPTRYGVSQVANPGVDVDSLSRERAVKLYRDKYWDALHLDDMEPAMAAAAFDTAVNHGVGKARAMIAAAGGSPARLIELRRAEYARLIAANPAKYARYARGWKNRLEGVAELVRGDGAAVAARERFALGRGDQFDPAPYMPEMRAIVDEPGAPLVAFRVAERLGIDRGDAERLLAHAAAQPDSGVSLVRSTGQYRRQARAAGGPVDAIAFLAERGGVRDDEGHGLRQRRDLQKLVPGRGPWIRPEGMSVDQAGELLHEAGYFPNSAERPTEREVLDFLEEAHARPAYAAADLNEVADRADAQRAAIEAGRNAEAEPNPERDAGREEALAAIDDHARDTGLALDEEARQAAAERVLDGMEPDEAATSAFADQVYERGPVSDVGQSAELDGDAGFDISGFDEPAGGAALARFDDPAGEGGARQVESLEHDLRMEVAANVAPRPAETRETIVAEQVGRPIEELHAAAGENQAALGRAGAEIAAEAGGSFVDPGVKSIERARQKVALEGYADPSEILDLTRGAFVIETPAQADAIAALLAERYAVHDKGWKTLGSGYLDRKLIVRFPNGGVGEVQIVPRQVWDAKKAGLGKLYNEARVAEGVERAALEARQREGYAAALASSGFTSLSSAEKSTSGNSASAASRESGAPSSDALPTSPGASRQPPRDQAQADDPTRATARSSTSNSSSDDIGDTSPGNIGAPGEAGNRPFRLDEGDERALGEVIGALDEEGSSVAALRACMKPEGGA